MCIISDTHLLQMALGFMQFLSFLYIFGVGFGVARFDKQAMPEPRDVGRVTGRFPRFFYV